MNIEITIGALLSFFVWVIVINVVASRRLEQLYLKERENANNNNKRKDQ